MASDSIKIDLSYKKLTQREYTSSEKKWHEEFAGKAINLEASDIWFGNIPDVPPVTSTAIVEVVDLTLQENLSVANSLCWYCFKNDERVGDFIQPNRSRSQAYFVRVFDNAGKQIYVGDDVAWEFDYENGILTFEKSPAAYAAPFHIKAYRYIGPVFGDETFPSSLNEIYHGGRAIDVDAGPMILNATNGSSALQINPIQYVPESDLADGQIINTAGILYVYDASRNRWVSMMRQTIVFGTKKADGRYLSVGGVQSIGFPCLRNGVILGITAQAASGYDKKRFSLINGSETILEFNLSDFFYVNADLNLPFDSGNVLKLLASSEFTPCNNVTVSLEIAWRV